MEDVQPFTQGPAATIAKLTQLVHLANRINRIVGDGIVKVTNTSQAITVGIDIEQLMARMPKTKSGVAVRWAQTTENATANAYITCNLLDGSGNEITSGTSSGIEVYCDIYAETALEDCVPLLCDDDVIPVVDKNGVWTCLWWFNGIVEHDAL